MKQKFIYTLLVAGLVIGLFPFSTAQSTVFGITISGSFTNTATNQNVITYENTTNGTLTASIGTRVNVEIGIGCSSDQSWVGNNSISIIGASFNDTGTTSKFWTSDNFGAYPSYGGNFYFTKGASDVIIETNTDCVDGEGSASAYHSFTVTNASDFSLSCSPASQTIAGGGSGSINLSTTASNGFNSAVNFTSSISPSSGTPPTVSYSNNGATPNATTTATINTTGSTTAGSYTITFTGTGGGQTHACAQTVTVTQTSTGSGTATLAIYDTPTVTFQINGSSSASILAGQSATLSWTPVATTSGTSCTAGDAWSGSKSSTPGSTYTQSTGTMNTPGTYTYTLACGGGAGSTSATQSVTLVVGANAPVADIKANGSDGPITISYNTSATISWSSTDATSCTVSPLGASGTSGSQSTGNLTTSTTYTLECTGPGGTDTDTVVVNVGAATPSTADIKANGSDSPITISYNSTATISWSSTDATSCTVTSSPAGFSQTGTSNGGVSSQAITTGTTFTINCAGPGGNSSDSVAVNVPGPTYSLDCTPATVTINAGSSTSFSLATTAQNGFNSAVTFTSSMSPNTGTVPSVSFTNNGAVPNATTTAVITTTAGTTSATYTITFNASGGSVVQSCATQLIVSAPTPPNPATNVTASNLNCGTITLSWTKASTGATPDSFNVYRSVDGSSWAQVGSAVPYTSDITYTFTDSAPLNPTGSNYYAVTALLNGSESSRAQAQPVSIVPVSCAPNIELSDKDLIQVNNNTTSATGAANLPCNSQSDTFSLPNNGVFKAGDVLRFRINVCNTGNQTLTNVRVTETLTNLTDFSYISSTNNCVSNYNSGTRTFTLNDLAPASGGVPTVCSITVSAKIASPGGPAGTLYRFINAAQITSDQANKTVQTPPYLFSVGSGVPDRTETN